MTDTATDQKSVPAWYEAAEEEYRRFGAASPADRARIQRQVDEINQVLADLGVTPLTPARAGEHTVLDAELLEADADRRLWAVDATHDGHQVVLQVQHWEYQDSPFLRGPALTSRALVVHAHRYGLPDPAPARDLSAEALRIADSLAGLDPAANPIAHQLRALTLALLHTAGSPANGLD